MIGKLLKALGVHKRLNGFVAPADQVEELKSIDEINDHFDKWVDDEQFWYERELFHLRERFAKALQEVATKRKEAKRILSARAITERDAEKALEVLEVIE